MAAPLLTLQRSMLATFDGMPAADIRRMNIATGATVCLFVGGLGVTLLHKGGKADGKIQTGPDERSDC